MEDGKPVSKAVKRYLDAYDVLIRRNEAVPILDKVARRNEPTLDARISARKPFVFPIRSDCSNRSARGGYLVTTSRFIPTG